MVPDNGSNLIYKMVEKHYKVKDKKKMKLELRKMKNMFHGKADPNDPIKKEFQRAKFEGMLQVSPSTTTSP